MSSYPLKLTITTEQNSLIFAIEVLECPQQVKSVMTEILLEFH